MKVEVRSKELVRPSSPTPESFKNYKLSFIDQIALNFKVPFAFFYDSSTISGASHHTIDELKKSLSKTLSLMYPLAGRVKGDMVTLECNDEGIEFVVADVAENMSCLLENPEMEKIKHLIPTKKVYEPRPVGKLLAAIQVNRFICGGIAIGLFVSHGIADASAVATFFETWASINRGGAVNGSGFISDHSAIFPPLTDTSAIERSVRMAVEAVEKEDKHLTVKRFVIPANAIAKLREELTINDKRPSRVEALTALVWAGVINATRKTQTQTQTLSSHKLSCAVNLRSRMEPPLPANCLGSVAHGTTVGWEAKEGTQEVTAVELVERIRDTLRAVNDGVARKMYGEGGVVPAVFARGDEIVREKDCPTLYTSSMCRQPYYEADFGWGKPRLVVNMLKNSSVIFLDAINGAVEVWMGLPKEVMHTLMQDNHLPKEVMHTLMQDNHFLGSFNSTDWDGVESSNNMVVI